MAAPVEMVVGDKATSASKSHSQAEKRRSDRINAQLTSLRKLIPKSDKKTQNQGSEKPAKGECRARQILPFSTVPQSVTVETRGCRSIILPPAVDPFQNQIRSSDFSSRKHIRGRGTKHISPRPSLPPFSSGHH
ncbi:hypothetical protein HN51_059650 [Arachis hypogaea]